jgi:hypothetical protein
MSETRISGEYKRVIFPLKKDSDGYPPNDWESLWAKEIKPGLFEIDNTPFFIKGISPYDIITTQIIEDEHYFEELVSTSGHSVIRVVFFDESAFDLLGKKLKELHCSVEVMNINKFITISIPPTTALNQVLLLLEKGENEELWEYEEGSIQHGEF